jgi:hypothetical protein
MWIRIGDGVGPHLSITRQRPGIQDGAVQAVFQNQGKLNTRKVV